MLRLLCMAALIMGGCSEPEVERARRRSDPERELFAGVNEERVNKGLKPLAWHDAAAGVARKHSEAMAERSFFSHVDPKRGNASQRLKAAGVSWTAVAENIYMQKGYSDPVRRAIEGWLQSPGHRRNIMNPTYTHTGLGVAVSPEGVQYCTQIFLVP